jgi:hypothetical protein
MDLIMRKYFGWEFKPALTAAIHKIAADCEIRNVNVQFKESIPTAAINRHGQILITNIKDDAVMSQLDLQKFTGFGLHELLHRKFTDFDQIDTSKSPYLLGLHNAIEDAYIENRAVRMALTGNAQGLLGLLIDTMATQALSRSRIGLTPLSTPSPSRFMPVSTGKCASHWQRVCVQSLTRLAPVLNGRTGLLTLGRLRSGSTSNC